MANVDLRPMTLGEVLDRYAKGGRGNPHQDALVRGFRMTQRNRADLLAFLDSLTDSELMSRPVLSDPFCQSASLPCHPAKKAHFIKRPMTESKPTRQ